MCVWPNGRHRECVRGEQLSSFRIGYWIIGGAIRGSTTESKIGQNGLTLAV